MNRSPARTSLESVETPVIRVSGEPLTILPPDISTTDVKERGSILYGAQILTSNPFSENPTLRRWEVGDSAHLLFPRRVAGGRHTAQDGLLQVMLNVFLKLNRPDRSCDHLQPHLPGCSPMLPMFLERELDRRKE